MIRNLKGCFIAYGLRHQIANHCLSAGGIFIAAVSRVRSEVEFVVLNMTRNVLSLRHAKHRRVECLRLALNHFVRVLALSFRQTIHERCAITRDIELDGGDGRFGILMFERFDQLKVGMLFANVDKGLLV
jgi:hypothetical protein